MAALRRRRLTGLRFAATIASTMRGMTPGAPVFLCGMMGSGKSTVGRVLATRMGCAFIDLDRRLERVTGRSVAELFAQRGEAGFRDAESLAFRGLLAEPGFGSRDVVVATGGGLVLRADHRALMRKRGRGVFLEVSLPCLVTRLSDRHQGVRADHEALAHRPLLGAADQLRERLQAVFEAREAHYRDTEFRVDAEGSPDVVAEAIAVALDPGVQTGETAPAGADSAHREP